MADPFVLNPPVAATSDYDDDDNWGQLERDNIFKSHAKDL